MRALKFVRTAFDVVAGGLKVVELAPEGATDEVREKTEAALVG